MECNPEGLSVLGYPILSDYDYEQEQGASREQGAGRGGADLKSELVVVFVRSDPEPSYYIAFA